MKPSQFPALSRMSEVADLMRDRDLGKVARIVQHMGRLQNDIAQLRAARDARRDDPSLDASRLSGADIAWQAWSDERIARAQAQIAALRVTHEAALSEARLAFGRADVMARLARRASDAVAVSRDPDD